jgi:hypothetical protein
MIAAIFSRRSTRSSSAGEMFSVSGSTSTKTGVAPRWSITCAVAQNVSVVVATLSPARMPNAASDTCMAAVPELTANAAGAPTNAENSSSNCLARAPVVGQPERRSSSTARIPSSGMSGGENGRKVVRMEW